jgi:hypothetical protein
MLNLPKHILSDILEWNGIIGYTTLIMEAYDAIRTAEAKNYQVTVDNGNTGKV